MNKWRMAKKELKQLMFLCRAGSVVGSHVVSRSTAWSNARQSSNLVVGRKDAVIPEMAVHIYDVHIRQRVLTFFSS
jgi:hypothetical protein